MILAQQKQSDPAERRRVRRRQIKPTARLEDPVHLAKRVSRRIGQMLQNLKKKNRIERARIERQGIDTDVAKGRFCASRGET